MGQVSVRKGIPYLLEAFAALRHPRKRLRVVGHVPPNMGKVLARHMFELCARHGHVDYAIYEGEIIQWVERFAKLPMGELEMTVAIGKYLDIFRRHRMLLDGRYTLLYISMMVAEGSGKKLDPELDLIQAARPFLEEALRSSMATKTAAVGV